MDFDDDDDMFGGSLRSEDDLSDSESSSSYDFLREDDDGGWSNIEAFESEETAEALIAAYKSVDPNDHTNVLAENMGSQEPLEGMETAVTRQLSRISNVNPVIQIGIKDFLTGDDFGLSSQTAKRHRSEFERVVGMEAREFANLLRVDGMAPSRVSGIDLSSGKIVTDESGVEWLIGGHPEFSMPATIKNNEDIATIISMVGKTSSGYDQYGSNNLPNHFINDSEKQAKAEEDLLKAINNVSILSDLYIHTQTKQSDIYSRKKEAVAASLTRRFIEIAAYDGSTAVLPLPNEVGKFSKDDRGVLGLKPTKSYSGGYTSPFTRVGFAIAEPGIDEAWINKVKPSLGNSLFDVDWENTDGLERYKSQMDEVYAMAEFSRKIFREQMPTTRDESKGQVRMSGWDRTYGDHADWFNYINDANIQGSGDYSSRTEYVRTGITARSEHGLEESYESEGSFFGKMKMAYDWSKWAEGGDAVVNRSAVSSDAGTFLDATKINVSTPMLDFSSSLPGIKTSDLSDSATFVENAIAEASLDKARPSFENPQTDRERYLNSVFDAPEQRSPDWYRLREGLITASSAGLLTMSLGAERMTNTLASERLGYEDPWYGNAYTEQGKAAEDLVKDAFLAHKKSQGINLTFEEAYLMVGEGEFKGFGASPDGVLFDEEGSNQGLLEMKFLTEGSLKEALRKHTPQMQMQMMFEQEEKMEFFALHAYTGEFVSETVYADADMQQGMLDVGRAALEVEGGYNENSLNALRSIIREKKIMRKPYKATSARDALKIDNEVRVIEEAMAAFLSVDAQEDQVSVAGISSNAMAAAGEAKETMGLSGMAYANSLASAISSGSLSEAQERSLGGRENVLSKAEISMGNLEISASKEDRTRAAKIEAFQEEVRAKHVMSAFEYKGNEGSDPSWIRGATSNPARDTLLGQAGQKYLDDKAEAHLARVEAVSNVDPAAEQLRNTTSQGARATASFGGGATKSSLFDLMASEGSKAIDHGYAGEARRASANHEKAKAEYAAAAAEAKGMDERAALEAKGYEAFLKAEAIEEKEYRDAEDIPISMRAKARFMNTNQGPSLFDLPTDREMNNDTSLDHGYGKKALKELADTAKLASKQVNNFGKSVKKAAGIAGELASIVTGGSDMVMDEERLAAEASSDSTSVANMRASLKIRGGLTDKGATSSILRAGEAKLLFGNPKTAGPEWARMSEANILYETGLDLGDPGDWTNRSTVGLMNKAVSDIKGATSRDQATEIATEVYDNPSLATVYNSTLTAEQFMAGEGIVIDTSAAFDTSRGVQATQEKLVNTPLRYAGQVGYGGGVTAETLSIGSELLDSKTGNWLLDSIKKNPLRAITAGSTAIAGTALLGLPALGLGTLAGLGATAGYLGQNYKNEVKDKRDLEDWESGFDTPGQWNKSSAIPPGSINLTNPQGSLSQGRGSNLTSNVEVNVQVDPELITTKVIDNGKIIDQMNSIEQYT